MAGYTPAGNILGGIAQALGGLTGQQNSYYGQQFVYTYSYTYGTNQATTANEIWGQWNTQHAQATTNVGINTWGQWNAQYTAEELARLQAQHAEMVKQQDDAKVKARALLLEHLSPVQREAYEKTGMFIVETTKKNRYRLSKSYNTQHRLDKNDRPTHSFCIHTHGVPREDELLGFKLLLEADEEQFLKVANATRVAA